MPHTDNNPDSHMNIKSVRKTANDALLSKHSASLRGYFHDDFLQFFSFPAIQESTTTTLKVPDLAPQREKFDKNQKIPVTDHVLPLKAPVFQQLPQTILTLPFGSTPTAHLPQSFFPSFGNTIPESYLPRRSPLINKGYACRVHVLDYVIADFLSTCRKLGKPSQILSMGAGYDTTYWRMKYHHGIHATNYIELDFVHTTTHKHALIQHNKQLLDVLDATNMIPFDEHDVEGLEAARKHALANEGLSEQEVDQWIQYHQNMNKLRKTDKFFTTYIHSSSSSSSSSSSPTTTQESINSETPRQQQQQQQSPFAINYHDYALIGCDARDVKSMTACLQNSIWNPYFPTLMLFECVLVYIPPLPADNLLRTLSTLHKSTLISCVYEQIHPFDPFGRTMMQNLYDRGCPLLALPTYPDLQHQRRRFRRFGYDTFTGWSLSQLANHISPCTTVELLDEMEEYHLMSSHYAVFIALRQSPDDLPPEEHKALTEWWDRVNAYEQEQLLLHDETTTSGNHPRAEDDDELTQLVTISQGQPVYSASISPQLTPTVSSSSPASGISLIGSAAMSPHSLDQLLDHTETTAGSINDDDSTSIHSEQASFNIGTTPQEKDDLLPLSAHKPSGKTGLVAIRSSDPTRNEQYYPTPSISSSSSTTPSKHIIQLPSDRVIEPSYTMLAPTPSGNTPRAPQRLAPASPTSASAHSAAEQSSPRVRIQPSGTTKPKSQFTFPTDRRIGPHPSSAHAQQQQYSLHHHHQTTEHITAGKSQQQQHGHHRRAYVSPTYSNTIEGSGAYDWCVGGPNPVQEFIPAIPTTLPSHTGQSSPLYIATPAHGRSVDQSLMTSLYLDGFSPNTTHNPQVRSFHARSFNSSQPIQSSFAPQIPSYHHHSLNQQQQQQRGSDQQTSQQQQEKQKDVPEKDYKFTNIAYLGTRPPLP